MGQDGDTEDRGVVQHIRAHLAESKTGSSQIRSCPRFFLLKNKYSQILKKMRILEILK
jgi:hypothetical protein